MKLGTTMLIHNKDDIQFVTEFPCFLGHPVGKIGWELEWIKTKQKVGIEMEINCRVWDWKNWY